MARFHQFCARPTFAGTRSERLCRTVLTLSALLIALLAVPLSCTAQSYDLVLKGGHLIDARNGIDDVMDIAISGDRVVRVASEIDASEAEQVVDLQGLYVSPGLIDLHTHIFFGTDPESDQMNSFRSVIPDMMSFRYGVTTMVDAGSSGWRNFELFKEQVIERSRTRILAFLRITGHGSKGNAYSQNLEDMDPVHSSEMAMDHPEIVGFKMAHYATSHWDAVDRLVEAGRLADKPVMLDFCCTEPPLSLETLFMEKLRPGDIYTHIYGGSSRMEPIVDEDGVVKPFVFEAQERGVLFDVGFGGWSYQHKVASPAIEQGLYPTTISSDLHMGSLQVPGMQDLNHVMSHLLAAGLPLQEVIGATTWSAAEAIHRPDLGHLSEGAIADLWVFGIREGTFGFVDADRPWVKIEGDRKLESEMTLFSGEIVWDRNGLAVPPFQGE
ncbi:MAG: amidohydrolase/deacetylase family metallohydrolase [Balneolaceae bacterium]